MKNILLILLISFCTELPGFSVLHAGTPEKISESDKLPQERNFHLLVYTSEDHSVQDIGVEYRGHNFILRISGNSGGQLSVRKSFLHDLQQRLDSVVSVTEHLPFIPEKEILEKSPGDAISLDESQEERTML